MVIIIINLLAIGKYTRNEKNIKHDNDKEIIILQV